jgi:hypothetical protein
VRYRGPDGKERPLTKRTRKLAEDCLSIVRSDLQRGTWVDPRRSARPFGDVAREWLADNTDKRPSAWARDESVLRVHLEPAIGDRPIGSLTPDDVRRLVEKVEGEACAALGQAHVRRPAGCPQLRGAARPDRGLHRAAACRCRRRNRSHVEL